MPWEDPLTDMNSRGLACLAMTFQRRRLIPWLRRISISSSWAFLCWRVRGWSLGSCTRLEAQLLGIVSSRACRLGWCETRTVRVDVLWTLVSTSYALHASMEAWTTIRSIPSRDKHECYQGRFVNQSGTAVALDARPATCRRVSTATLVVPSFSKSLWCFLLRSVR